VNLWNIGAGRQTDPKLVLMPRFKIILRQALADFTRGGANHRILICIVLRIPLEYLDSEGTLFQTFKAILASLFNHIS
jgi:hypothetical protein